MNANKNATRPDWADADVVDAFKATGKGWQTRMNAALRDWLKAHSAA